MSRKIKLFVSIIISLGTGALAQSSYLTSIGYPNTGIQLPTAGGTVDVTNGNLHVEIPLGNPTQRGSVKLQPRLIYDSRIWQPNSVNGNWVWAPNNVSSTQDDATAPSGWRFVIGSEYNNWGSTITTTSQGFVRTNFYFTDAEGTTHSFNLITVQPFPDYYESTGPYNDSGSAYASDESGYVGIVSNYRVLTVYDPNGNIVTGSPLTQGCAPNCSFASIPFAGGDTNGNFNSTDANGNLIDTDGRIPVLVTNSGNTTTYSVLVPGGGRASYVVTYANVTYQTGFNESQVQEASGMFSAIQKITLPDGSYYLFTYQDDDPSGMYGELTQITLPQGGEVNYTYKTFMDTYGASNRWLVYAIMDPLQTGESNVYTAYTPIVVSPCFPPIAVANCSQTVLVTNAFGAATFYTTTQNNSYSWSYQTDSYDGATPIVVSSRANIYNTLSEPRFHPTIAPQPEWLTATTVTTTLANGLTSRQQLNFAQPWTGKPTSSQAWDYYTGTAPALPDRESDFTYDAVGGFIYKLTSEKDYGGGQLLSAVNYGYDESTVSPTTSLPQHQSPPSEAVRGNLTSVTIGGSPYSATLTYDDAGMLLSSTPPNGNASANPAQFQTTYSYDPTDTYVIQTTGPSTNGIAHVTTTGIDPFTGAPNYANDENSVALTSSLPTQYFYFQPGSSAVGKLQSVIYPDGGSTSYSYPNPTQRVTTIARSGGTSETITDTTDQLGRPMLHNDNGIQTAVTYDLAGRQQCVTHPYIPGTASPTDGLECVVAFDGFDRPLTVQHPDGSQKHLSYTGNVVNVTDESGHVMAYADDAYGELVHVWEPDATGGLNWRTDYIYDGLGRQVQAVQNGDGTATQTRAWNYDLAGNLISEQTPEAGLTCYGSISGGNCTENYDADGNVKQKTDADLNVSTYSYDVLDRLTNVTATAPAGGTSVVNTYTYDVPPTGTNFQTNNAIGHLVASMSSSGTGEAFSYDVMGRVNGQTSCLPSGCANGLNTISASYDIAGNLQLLTYPDGLQIKNAYDSNGRLQASWLPPAQQGYAQVWSAGGYYPTGQVSAASFGVVNQKVTVNNRGNVTALEYDSLWPTTMWKRSYGWDWNGTNLNREVDEISGVTRQYTYDQVSRVTSASDSGTGTVATGSLTVSGADGTHLDCGFSQEYIFAAEFPGLAGVPTWADDAADFVCVDQSGSHPPPAGCQLAFNRGDLQVSIGGFPFSVPFNEYSTANGLKDALMQAINAAGVDVTASTSWQYAATINLRSVATGSGANYSLTVPPSSSGFQITASGPTMTGGTDSAPAGGLQETYTYDPWGNMQQSGNFIFNPPLGISTSNNQISAALYDSAGNMTQDALGTQNRYDPLQQLISAGSSVVNTYDANGDLVAKTTGGSTEEYAYFGNQLMAVYQPTTNAWTDFIYANGQRVQMLTGTVNGFSSIGPNGTQSSVLTDIQGSTVGIVQPGSAPPSLSESHDYAPFGQMLNRAGGDTRFQFLGMEYNPTTNSYNSLTRAYSGAASRWMSPDSYEGSYNPIDPQSLNRYSYVGGRSTAYRDPSGMAGDQGGGFCILCIIGDIFDPFGGLAGAGPVYTPPKSQVDVMNHIGGFKIPTGLPRQVNIIGMLGLPSAGGCEFGACGGDSQSFTQGEASAAISVESGMLKYLASRYVFGPYLLDPFDSNHRLFGTHYCGPGGGGDETSTLDHDCHLHDDCYTGFGVSASVNLPGNHSTPLRPDQIAGITGCNQKLADAARSLGSAYGAKSITLWLTHGYGFLYPGTAAH